MTAQNTDMQSADQTVAGIGTAAVSTRPILLFPVVLLLGFGLDHLVRIPYPLPRFGLAHLISAGVAGALVIIGIALFAAAVTSFSRAATPLPTNAPARVLVTSGIFRWTRNPIYLSFFLVYVGIGLAVHSPWILILTQPMAVAIRYGVVACEESYLERRFGQAYCDYKARVRRWV